MCTYLFIRHLELYMQQCRCDFTNLHINKFLIILTPIWRGAKRVMGEVTPLTTMQGIAKQLPLLNCKYCACDPNVHTITMLKVAHTIRKIEFLSMLLLWFLCGNIEWHSKDHRPMGGYLDMTRLSFGQAV